MEQDVFQANENEFSVPLHIRGTNVRKIALGSCQDCGVRPYQEDSFGFSDISDAAVQRNGLTAVVADGMGGLSKSERISSMLVQGFVKADYSGCNEKQIAARFRDLLQQANAASQGSGGGSTLVAVHCSANGVFWCSIGDSRIYLFRKGRLFQVTEDTDYQRDLFVRVHQGDLDIEDAISDPQKDALSAFVGMVRFVEPECSRMSLRPELGDKLLLCSDGVYNALSQQELEAALTKGAQTAAELLNGMIRQKRYSNQDNYSAVVLEFLN